MMFYNIDAIVICIGENAHVFEIKKVLIYVFKPSGFIIGFKNNVPKLVLENEYH